MQPGHSHPNNFFYSTSYYNPYEVKHRKRTTRAQLTLLEATFAQNRKPPTAVKKAVASRLDMPIRSVQVWFQNRRAKEKLLQAKAKKAAMEQREGDGSNDDVDPKDESGSEDDMQNDDAPDSVVADTKPGHSSTSPPSTAPSTSPSFSTGVVSGQPNLAARRGSAPTLGFFPHPPEVYPNPSNPSIVRQPAIPRNNGLGKPPMRNPLAPQPPLPSGDNPFLGRRSSLPSFRHPLSLHYSQAPGSTLPTIDDVPFSPDKPYAPPLYQAPDHQSSTEHLSPPTASQQYRFGSTPGPGNFRVPTAPFYRKVSPLGANEFKVPPAPFAGADVSGAFNVPVRRIPDSFAPGPLPQADFSFGAHDEPASNENGSLPTAASGLQNDASDLFAHRNPQQYRFSSIASSAYSVETDGTAATATTGTSDNSPFSADQYANLYNSRASLAPPRGQYLGPAGGQFPQGFAPDLRRASCPAQFVDMFSHMGVESAGAPPLSNLSASSLTMRQQVQHPLQSDTTPSGPHGSQETFPPPHAVAGSPSDLSDSATPSGTLMGSLTPPATQAVVGAQGFDAPDASQSAVSGPCQVDQTSYPQLMVQSVTSVSSDELQTPMNDSGYHANFPVVYQPTPVQYGYTDVTVMADQVQYNDSNAFYSTNTAGINYHQFDEPQSNSALHSVSGYLPSYEGFSSETSNLGMKVSSSPSLTSAIGDPSWATA